MLNIKMPFDIIALGHAMRRVTILDTPNAKEEILSNHPNKATVADTVNGPVFSWYDNKEKLHRNGAPARKFDDGTEMWFRHGVLHRFDGPAITWANGTQEWYMHGKEPNNFKEYQEMGGCSKKTAIMLHLKYGKIIPHISVFD